jgi:hypothetical protein
VKANRLSLRPSSKWALDIPRNRFQAKAVIVTAPSAVDLHAMKGMRSQLEQIVQTWEQRKQVCRVVSSIVSSKAVCSICTHHYSVITHCVLVDCDCVRVVCICWHMALSALVIAPCVSLIVYDQLSCAAVRHCQHCSLQHSRVHGLLLR